MVATIKLHHMGVSINGVPPELDGLFHGKSQPRVDDDWGYPHDLGNPQMNIAGQSAGRIATSYKPIVKVPSQAVASL